MLHDSGLTQTTRMAVWRLLVLACLLPGLPASIASTDVPAENRAASNQQSDLAAELQNTSVQQAALHLARQAALKFLKTRKTPEVPSTLPAALRRRAGVFVTIEKRGRVTPRGCRGTLAPAYPSLAEEIIHNAIAACTRDKSEPPLRASELAQCLISLTVVQRIEPIQSIAQHDAEHNGLIAQSGRRIGIVLPYEGRDAATQLRWAKRKAGLPDGAAVQLRELCAVRFRESRSN